MIGQRLKLARTASGLSLSDLEPKLGNRVTAQILSKYERDELMPSSQVLIGLARALDVSEEYLLGEQRLVFDCEQFTGEAGKSAREEAQVAARALLLLEHYLTIEEIFGLQTEWDELRKDKAWQTKPDEKAGAMPTEKESPKRLERLCNRALAEGTFSEAKAAELLGISARELNRRLDQPESGGAMAPRSSQA